ncbi:DUF4158 domain-containing protein [Nonomuraea jabiensis]|uniref:DUF4158 domain-containing protein n=1 Tax=Nonomuraea jabiensis TaxID=882448 RepID=UPI003D740F96
MATFIASWVRTGRDSRRELFDRAVLWLITNRVLLPGITALSRLVTEVRRAELEAINRSLAMAAPPLRWWRRCGCPTARGSPPWSGCVPPSPFRLKPLARQRRKGVGEPRRSPSLRVAPPATTLAERRAIAEMEWNRLWAAKAGVME